MSQKTEFYCRVGDRGQFSKTIGESDVYLFAGMTGDFAGNHIDEEYMKRSSYGRRIVQGALIVGFMATAATQLIGKLMAENNDETPVALGYDRVRFLKPVFINDTITVIYTVAEIDIEKRRSKAKIEVVNQHHETVAVAEHLVKWVKNPMISR